MSDTYPSLMIVPSTVSDEILKTVSTYRSKGRIPSLSWIHPFNSASITRSSQPLVSLKRNRCVEDEYLLNVIREMTGTSNQFLYIYDARYIIIFYLFFIFLIRFYYFYFILISFIFIQ